MVENGSRLFQHMLKTLVLGLFASTVGVSAQAAVESEKGYQWSELNSMPIRVQEIYPVLHQHNIIVAGGLSPDVSDKPIDVTNRVFTYTPSSNDWQELLSLPEPRHHPQLVSTENKLYAIGGFTINQRGAWHNSKDVYWYDNSSIEGAKWQRLSPMPEPLSETLAAVYAGKVHIATGRSPITADKNGEWRDQTDSDAHWIYDPKLNQWQAGPNAPTKRNSACGVQLQGKWHIIGGRTVVGGNLDTHEVYDFDTQTWSSRAALPDTQGGLACAVLENAIYVFGGEFFNDGGGVYDAVWRYDNSTNTWQHVSKMPVARHGLGAIALDDRIIVIAGAAEAGGNQTSNRVSQFTKQ